VYQMLGRRIVDLDRLESEQGAAPGLGLLPVVTRFSSQKQTHQTSGWVSGDHGLLAGAKDLPFEGYEIHM
jgi:adenosylcobyric acid synthase